MELWIAYPQSLWNRLWITCVKGSGAVVLQGLQNGGCFLIRGATHLPSVFRHPHWLPDNGLLDKPGWGRQPFLPLEAARRVLEQVAQPHIGKPRWIGRSMTQSHDHVRHGTVTLLTTLDSLQRPSTRNIEINIGISSGWSFSRGSIEKHPSLSNCTGSPKTTPLTSTPL